MVPATGILDYTLSEDGSQSFRFYIQFNLKFGQLCLVFPLVSITDMIEYVTYHFLCRSNKSVFLLNMARTTAMAVPGSPECEKQMCSIRSKLLAECTH